MTANELLAAGCRLATKRTPAVSVNFQRSELIALMTILAAHPDGIICQHPADNDLSKLSAREREVFLMIGQGKTNPEIVNALGIGDKTLESHKAHIKEKLDILNGVELQQRAFKHVCMPWGKMDNVTKMTLRNILKTILHACEV